MVKLMKSVCLIVACSIACVGCGLTVGPQVETRYVFVKSGATVRILENKTLRCKLMKDEEGCAVKQDVGGWVAMPPAHWEDIKKEIKTLRAK